MAKKILKIIKIFLIFLYFLFFASLLVLEFWFGQAGSGFSVAGLIYWMIFILWTTLVWKFKWKSGLSLIYAFAFFLISIILVVFGLWELGESVMKVSFIGWLIGITQVLLERYRKDKI